MVDIFVDGIFGLDFFVKYKVIINMCIYKVFILGIEYFIYLEGMVLEYKIVLINRVVIFFRFEILIEGKICVGLDGGFLVKIGFKELFEKLIKLDFVMLVRFLV